MERTQESRFRAWAFSIVVLTARQEPAPPLTVTFDERTTRILTELTQALFGDRCQRHQLSIAALGQGYTVDQLTQQGIAPWFATQIADSLNNRFPNTSLPVLLPIAPCTMLTALPIPVAPRTAELEASDEPPYFQAIGFPCALLGTAAAIRDSRRQRADPLSPVDREHPALTTLEGFLSAELHLRPEELFVVAPLRAEQIRPWVAEISALFRRERALLEARFLARRAPAVLIATVACYRDREEVRFWSVVIQRADTLDVIAAYRYHAEDFPEGPPGATHFLDELVFAWGVQHVEVVPGALPIVQDASGKLIVYRQTPEFHTVLPPACQVDRGH